MSRRTRRGVRSKSDVKRELALHRKRIAELQARLYAEQRQSLLIVLQAMDTGGKDGAIKHVFRASTRRAVACGRLRRLAPSEFRLLPEWGIGLTDVCKTAHGMDHEIAADAFDPARLRTVLDEVRPHAIAFNGKKAGRLAFRLRDSAPIDLGPTAHILGATPAWVLPSTSGANARYWDAAPWHALAAALPPVP
jgi:G:T/U-mismatch repair DNA glycosylase